VSVKMKFSVFCCIVVLFTWLASASFAAPMLAPGDRMVFLGDSITEQRLYTRFVMDYVAMRYPDAKISFRNAGWGGDTSPGGLRRLQRDVLSLNPTVVSICFGMNDAGYGKFNQETYDRYIQGMKGLVSELKKAGVKVVLLTPGCIDHDRNEGLKGYNDTLARFAQGVEELARKERVPVYNIHTLMLDVQTKLKSDDPEFTMIPDSVHPNPAGHIPMAYGLIKALGCTDQASGLEINASDSTFTPDRCKVSNLKITDDSITFTRTDSSLPMYLPDEVQPVLKYLPFTQELNRYPFKVTGIKPGDWKLTVQGIEVGTFSAEELASGVDLSTYPGPWQELGKELDRLTWNQENLYFIRWREVGLGPLSDDAKSILQPIKDNFDKTISDWEDSRIKLVTKNRNWKWSLTR